MLSATFGCEKTDSAEPDNKPGAVAESHTMTVAKSCQIGSFQLCASLGNAGLHAFPYCPVVC